MSAVPETPPTWIDMGRDVDLALALAQGRPTGPTADEVRKRLRSYIGLLADPAETYAKGLADSRARDIATATVEHARGLSVTRTAIRPPRSDCWARRSTT